MTELKKVFKFKTHIIFIYEDRVEGYLSSSNTNGMSDICFYNDNRGMRCGGSRTLSTDFKEAENLIKLYYDALILTRGMKDD